MSVATPNDDETRGFARAGSCAACGGAFARDQRYCLECGARRGALPPAVAARLATLLRRDRGEEEPPTEESAAEAASPAPAGFMPSPRAAAVAVMGMLALGVLLGSATSQIAQSAGLELDRPRTGPPGSAAERSGRNGERRAGTGARSRGAAGDALQRSVRDAPVRRTGSGSPATDPAAGILRRRRSASAGQARVPDRARRKRLRRNFGEGSTAPYLAQTLPEQGELVSNYYAVTQGELANQIALLSGQGPTAETAADCPNYTDIVPGHGLAAGQVEGSGCVYPAETPTLPGQLGEKELKWKAYVEGSPANGRPAPPRPTTHDGRWRNPFVYFHSVLDAPECATDDVSLDQLAPDLKSATKTPTLSYIVPDACHAGGEGPCEEGQPAGPAAVEEFLRQVVPAIEASPAYKEGGLIAITSSQARQTGATPDAGSCCIDPAYPNLPAEAGRHGGPGSSRPGQAERRRRPGRPAAALALRRARHHERQRLLQPLLAAAQHRGTVRT